MATRHQSFYKMNNTRSLNYKDIHLIPNRSTLKSRSQADLSLSLGKWKFKLPVVPANMASTISFEKAQWLASNGYFYILHRFYDYRSILDWIASSNPETLPFVSLSIGIKDRDYDLLKEIASNKLRLDFITVDVAHGDHSEVQKMAVHLRMIQSNYCPNLFIIGGNIATSSAYRRMAPYVDAVKVGIACGASCITYNKTGFASPMFSTIKAIAETRMYGDPMVIADGGISNNGDIAKALVAGADMVMAGSIFASCSDSPAPWATEIPNKKIYFGSASSMNGNNKNIEGRTLVMDCNGMSYQEKLKEIGQDLASAVSYAGGSDLRAFRDVEYAIME